MVQCPARLSRLKSQADSKPEHQDPVSHMAQMSGLLPRILKHRNQQPDEEIHRARSRTKNFQSSWSLVPSTVAHGGILLHQPGISLKPLLLDFNGGFTTQAWLITQ